MFMSVSFPVVSVSCKSPCVRCVQSGETPPRPFPSGGRRRMSFNLDGFADVVERLALGGVQVAAHELTPRELGHISPSFADLHESPPNIARASSIASSSDP